MNKVDLSTVGELIKVNSLGDYQMSRVADNYVVDHSGNIYNLNTSTKLKWTDDGKGYNFATMKLRSNVNYPKNITVGRDRVHDFVGRYFGY